MDIRRYRYNDLDREEDSDDTCHGRIPKLVIRYCSESLERLIFDIIYIEFDMFPRMRPLFKRELDKVNTDNRFSPIIDTTSVLFSRVCRSHWVQFFSVSNCVSASLQSLCVPDYRGVSSKFSPVPVKPPNSSPSSSSSRRSGLDIFKIYNICKYSLPFLKLTMKSDGIVHPENLLKLIRHTIRKTN